VAGLAGRRMTAAPLGKADARALDKRVRLGSARLIADAGKLMTLIEQAEHGEIHVALGCSARAWVSDAVQIPRKALATIAQK
jgi:hypothetical protein